jgi:uncharacterized protein (TIGR02452 family)
MGRDENIAIFEDTVNKVESGSVVANSVTTKHSFSDIKEGTGNPRPVVSVWDGDTVSVLQQVAKSTEKICLLNMASRKKAGGGVRNGSVAQEECLFRSSNLFETVVQDFYPLGDEECLYTKDAVFFKDFHYNMIPDHITTDVVTVAAINLNENSYFDSSQGGWVNVPNDKPEGYEELTKQKIRLMLSLASERADDVILGAWGCGVFKNDPREMATMFKEVIEEGYDVDVHFAIINDHNSVANNYEIFKEVLGA